MFTGNHFNGDFPEYSVPLLDDEFDVLGTDLATSRGHDQVYDDVVMDELVDLYD